MTSAADVLTYSVGDYVWIGGHAHPQLAHVESAHPVGGPRGHRWLVRLRNKSGWTSGSVHTFVDRSLSPNEVAHNRQLGLIPPAGEALR